MGFISSHLYEFRSTLSFYLFVFFGYIYPGLNSVEAITSKNISQIKEYLTYWTVSTMILYIEAFLNLFNVFSKYPPEIKVFLIIWLILFNGAIRIYHFILKPYFDKYEKDIDQEIAVVSQKVRLRFIQHFQLICWQLFLSPDIGVLGSVAAGVRQLIAPTIPRKVAEADSSLDKNKSMSSSALSKKLLNEFSSMLSEGVYLQVSNFGDCKITLSTDHMFLSIAAAGEEASLRQLLRLSIISIVDISMSEDSDAAIQLTIQQTGQHISTLQLIQSASEETEALLAGMQILALSTRNRYTRGLGKVFKIASRFVLRSAWNQLQAHTQYTGQ